MAVTYTLRRSSTPHRRWLSSLKKEKPAPAGLQTVLGCGAVWRPATAKRYKYD